MMRYLDVILALYSYTTAISSIKIVRILKLEDILIILEIKLSA